jgi:hypothetical protein
VFFFDLRAGLGFFWKQKRVMDHWIFGAGARAVFGFIIFFIWFYSSHPPNYVLF